MKLALVGDVHGSWDARDVSYFNDSDEDLILITGDLPRLTGNAAFRVAQRISLLRKPYAIIAGNHDCATWPAFLGEITHQDLPSRLAGATMEKRYRRLGEIFGNNLLGYSALKRNGLTVMGARPFAMDGMRLSFAPALERLFGISTIDASSLRLTELLGATNGPTVVLAHNGPAGLGAEHADPFGADFKSAGGDNGDADLAAALAAHPGRAALVVAGHMHHAVKGRKDWPRRMFGHVGSTLVVNAARVPRHDDGFGHYLRVTLDGNTAHSLVDVRYGLAGGPAEVRPVWRAQV